VTLTDISARKQAEMRLRRSEQSLRTLYELTSAVSRARSLEGVYALALDVLIGAIGADRVAVLLFDADGVMRFVASRGLTDSYRAAVEGHSPWAPDEQSPVPVAVPDVAEDASLGALRQTIMAEGIGALAVIPLTLEQALGRTALEYWSDKVAAAQVMANDRELTERGKAVAFEETILLADGAHTFPFDEDAAARCRRARDRPRRSVNRHHRHQARRGAPEAAGP
jgi:hypothetical protein